MITRLVFWIAITLLGWTYAGFPIVCLARARLHPRPVRRAPIRPRVSIVLAARNEEGAIHARIENLLALDYPQEDLEIVVASDGSVDSTVAIARQFSPRVVVLDLPRTGKARALTEAVHESSGEIVVFTDANTSFRSDAVTAIVEPFGDPEVGGVAGDQRYLPAAPGPHGPDGVGERHYWDFDRRLKSAESAAGSVISATGALYAVRRALFEPIPEGVTDDFITSTLVVAKGSRLVFEPRAVADEPVAESERVEFGRKVRIMTRGLRGVVMRRELLDPRRTGFYAVQLLTHKLLRRLMVFPLIAASLSSVLLARRSRFHALAAVGAATIASCGVVGLAGPPSLRPRRVFALPGFFLMVNGASLVAVSNALRGRRIVTWEPQRGQDSQEAE